MSFTRTSFKTIGRLSLTAALATGALAARPMLAQVNADPVVQADVNKALDKKQFANVKGVAHNSIVTLTGTVDVYAQKEDADRRIHHLRTVSSVQNEIQVGGPQVEDTTLRNKLAEKISYDRVGYGTTAFNSFTIGVQNGVVTLGGTAYGPVDKDSAISLAANYPGVKDIVDNIEVAPLSPNDDRIRIAEARAIYGFPTLNRYAMDPAKPIRITVVGGNVTLNGVVDTKADRDTANIRANAVPGVFKVTNNLQVASSGGGN